MAGLFLDSFENSNMFSSTEKRELRSSSKMPHLSTEDVVRDNHESNDIYPAGNLKYSTKESIIEDIRMRAEDGIIEPSNAELLIKLINNAEDLNEAISIAALGTMYKRTGLYFDVRLEKQDSNTIHYLKKNEKYSFYDSENPNLNRLIIGDNYHALQNLMVMHSEPFVDVIYIDPPYSKDSIGRHAKTNYKNDITRDNLLSQLYPRLVLAKQLLKEDGVIFCSIDDKNHAYVKLLFDEVFGETNFITSFVWQKKKGGGQAKYVYEGHEYVLSYAKNKARISGLYIEDKKKIQEDKIIEKDGRKYFVNDDFIRAVFGKYKSGTERRCHYEDLLELKGADKYNEVNKKLETGEYVLRESDTQPGKHYVCRLEDITEGKRKIIYTILSGMIEGTRTEDGNNQLDSIGLSFDDVKPLELLKIIIGMTNNKNAVVLDFYAGSGTTGQAVLELNKEDGGNRTFILCTNNEPEDGYIADNVTTKRLKRVMTGCCYDGTSDFPWAKKNQPLGGSLEVYDICSVANFEMTEGKTPFDVIDETAYGKEKMELQDKIKWVCESFERTQPILAEKNKEATS